jgi:hypothetical protein
MKNTLVRIDPKRLPVLPKAIAAGRYRWKDVDAWMRSLGAKPIPARERARLRKAGLLGMPSE